jgi:4-hydroxy-3-methylbut-2-enyl diphosphate reductase
MIIEIDSRSGFCFGVVNAIKKAEDELSADDTLYCLGEIVHNSEEVERLKKMGLITITHSDLDKLGGKKVLLRAHGEPPETYRKVKEKGIKLIDASCPVVLKLQQRVRKSWEQMQAVGGQIIIFGKKGHAEVIGLMGQTDGNAMVIQSLDEIKSLDLSRPIELFAQTTMSADEYKLIASAIENEVKRISAGKDFNFKAHNSICGQVSNRKEELKKFASKHDVILFVSGKSSSNGKMLYEVCRSINPRTHFISSSKELEKQWLHDAKSVGICGATSTPRWLMEEVAERIEKIDV